ncbi:hypothetical protein EP331_01610 [bacterium]|nr:MAG: hypothetical protein EP331_01610 [bacterium]
MSKLLITFFYWVLGLMSVLTACSSLGRVTDAGQESERVGMDSVPQKSFLAMPIYYSSGVDTLEVLLPFVPFSLDSTCLKNQLLKDTTKLERLSGDMSKEDTVIATYIIRDYSNIDSLMANSSFSVAYTETSVRMDYSDSSGYSITSDWFIIKKTSLDRSLSQRAKFLVEKVMKDNHVSPFFHQYMHEPNPVFDEFVLFDPTATDEVPIHYSTTLPSASVVSLWVEDSGPVLSRISFLPMFLDDAILVHHVKVAMPESQKNLLNSYQSLAETDTFIRYSKTVMDELEFLYHSNRLYIRTQLARLTN